ncbi:type 1 periplasmic-binding domain-containing protein [Lentzea nigeriaca]|uniref:hypothetical protein n=1 Tax=Lentzea nigeriaca TaxID=1128665 RepID=UPI00195B7E42|nr:hypothetical protein [Lentzea nigeriaca]MBM7860459.1 hypothetical protein [Lentzea nigeriaca]
MNVALQSDHGGASYVQPPVEGLRVELLPAAKHIAEQGVKKEATHGAGPAQHHASSDRLCRWGNTFPCRRAAGFLELMLCPHPVTAVFGTFEPPDRLDAICRLCLNAWSTDTMPMELLERLVVHISAGNFRRVG